MASRSKHAGAAGSVRSKTFVYLIGNQSLNITGTKLPSNRQVLRMLFFCTRQCRKSIDESAYLVIDAATIFWRQASIPTMDKGNTKKKLVRLYEEWKTLVKTKNRRDSNQVGKEQKFLEKLDDLFDIAHADAMNTMQPRQIEFLNMQRMKGRPSNIQHVYENELVPVKRKAEQQEENRRKRMAYEDELREACKFIYIKDFK